MTPPNERSRTAQRVGKLSPAAARWLGAAGTALGRGQRHFTEAKRWLPYTGFTVVWGLNHPGIQRALLSVDSSPYVSRESDIGPHTQQIGV